jgi:hypothetical protein
MLDVEVEEMDDILGSMVPSDSKSSFLSLKRDESMLLSSFNNNPDLSQSIQILKDKMN